MAFTSFRPRLRTRTARARAAAALRVILAAGIVGMSAPFAATAMPGATPAFAREGCPVISGYVYYDVNNNGLRDSGELPIANSQIELRKGDGTLAGFALTDSAGYYQFDTDASGGATLSASHSASFARQATDWSATRTIPRFDPALGTLKSVLIEAEGDIQSRIRVENLDTSVQTIHAEVEGTLTISPPGGGAAVVIVPTLDVGQFDAPAYDGTKDFAGPSGKDFGVNTATNSGSRTISDPAAVLAFVGSGNVTFTADAVATSAATASGNVAAQIDTTASASLEVTYRYVAPACLTGGNYTIVQKVQPPGYTDGRETRGNTTPIPGSDFTDAISITLGTSDLPNNNFGELRSGISGYVYHDADNDGIKDAGEAPIAGVTVLLACTDSSGAQVNRSTVTNAVGYYEFIDLLAGTCEINEVQPAGWLDGKDTIGTPGGSTANDRFYAINLPAGFFGVNNNFGELLPQGSTPPLTLSPTPTPTCVPGTIGCPNVTPTPTCVPGTAGCPYVTPTPTCVPGTIGCPFGTPTPTCVPGTIGCPITTPTPTCVPGTSGCTVTTPTPTCVPGSFGCPFATATRTPTCSPGSANCPKPGTPGGSAIAGQTQPVGPSSPTPGAPGAGSGFLDTAKSFNGILIGLAIFAASGWLAFLALGKRRELEDEGLDD